MVILAKSYGQGPVPIRTIAERENISEQYLEQIFIDLRRSKLVDSVRGAHGGYVLGRPPQEIKISEVLIVLEGPIAPADCVAGTSDQPCCDRTEPCATHQVWRKLRDSMVDVLEGITLEDLRTGKQL
jgi:Rrf2 family protein